MCGITGLVSLDGHLKSPAQLLWCLNRRLAHRGPDDEGYLLVDLAGRRAEALHGDGSRMPNEAGATRHIRDGGGEADAALAHRRLSILDPSPAGHQPMSSPDGRYHLVYNGEIYNFVELRQELESAGHRFRSHGDTEVVLAALTAWGADALSRFVGMFALAWLDVDGKRMLLARDMFGIKPLCYVQTDSLLAFASEASALLEVPGVARRVDPHAAYSYLRYNVTDHDERTFFDPIKQLPPAHYLTVDLQQRGIGTPRRFWRADGAGDNGVSYQEARRQLQTRFLDSVRIHLRSDVPVAVMLSGGIDSSSVTMGARRALGPSARLEAFSYIASEPRADESRWIELVAGAANIEVHRIRPAHGDLVTDLEQVISSQGAPFGSLSILAQYCVFRAVHEAGIKVILSGQGADELLGGYSPFASARLASLVRSGRWLAAARFYRRGSRGWPGRRRLTMGLAQQLLPAMIQRPLRRVLGKQAVPAWLNGDWFRQRDVPLHSVRDQPDGAGEPLKAALQDSLTRTNLPELLRYEDRNSMAHSVESRVPFLAAPLAEFVLGLPEEYIINDRCITKACLRDAMRSVVPDAILDRRDKVAFSAPLRQWFDRLQPWMDARLRGETARRIGVFHTDPMIRVWDSVSSGRTKPPAELWRWVNLIAWAERFEVVADV